MRAGQTTLRQLIGGEKQYRVPLFQRPYAWTASHLRQLWSDIVEQHEILRAEGDGATGNPRLHFIGSFVLAPEAALPHGVAPFLVIDGQQRLTTLLIALAAVRDALRETNPKEATRMDQQYVLNGSVDGQERYKLLPTQADRQVFFACTDGLGVGNSDSHVAAAYRFFAAKLGDLQDGGGNGAVQPELIQRVILDRLSVIDIVTDTDDNPHRIFESLNATGLQLTQADLLRNYLFMLLPTRQTTVYETVWKPMEQQLGEEHLEAYARHNLARRIGRLPNHEEVYREYQTLLEPMARNEAAVEQELRELARLAPYFRRLVEPRMEPNQACAAYLDRLRRWGAQTTYPLLLHVYDLVDRGLAGAEDLRGVLVNVESFLVRRYLAGIATNTLNKLFIDVTGRLKSEQPLVESLRASLSAERRYWPTDEQVREAVASRPFYVTGRAEQRKVILERLEESYGHLEGISPTASLTIEHVMPQTLDEEWKRLLVSQGDDPDEVWEQLGHTLGNLTLTAYNSRLSNSPFERKRQIYDYSHLELNREIEGFATWGRSAILERADRLADRIISIWPGPVAGSRGAVVGFDWGLVDAAVAAIPAGRWTSYGDLALLGGTAPQAVGNRMATNGSLKNAYRVLDTRGAINPGFRWPDPSDARDPRAILVSEGVIFDSEERADSSCRLNALELADLIAYEFEPEELERLQRVYHGPDPVTDGLWREDGRTWHLEHICGPVARDILLGLEKLLGEVTPDLPPPSWNQKYYVAWRRNGKNTILVHPRQGWLWVEFIEPSFSAADAATRLGFVLVPEGESPSWKQAGPSQVQIAGGGVWVQLRSLSDLEEPRRSVLQDMARETLGLPIEAAVRN